MNRLSPVRVLALGAIILFLTLGCSHRSGSPMAPDDVGDLAGGTISLGTPVVDGDGISVPVEFSGAVDLYALSFRVGFDPEKLSPVAVEWSDELGEEDSTFQTLDRKGFVPLAFVRFNGISGLRGNGRLCTLRFRRLGEQDSTPWIIADREYLVAYNALRSRLILDVGGEAR